MFGRHKIKSRCTFLLTNNRHNRNKRRLMNNAVALPPLSALHCVEGLDIVIHLLAAGPLFVGPGGGGKGLNSPGSTDHRSAWHEEVGVPDTLCMLRLPGSHRPHGRCVYATLGRVLVMCASRGNLVCDVLMSPWGTGKGGVRVLAIYRLLI